MMHACGIGIAPRLVILARLGRIVRSKRPSCPIRSAPPAPNRNLSFWIPHIDWIVADVVVEIHTPARKLLWILAQEPAAALVVVPRTVKVELGLRVELPCRVLEWVGERPGGSSDLTV